MMAPLTVVLFMATLLTSVPFVIHVKFPQPPCSTKLRYFDDCTQKFTPRSQPVADDAVGVSKMMGLRLASTTDGMGGDANVEDETSPRPPTITIKSSLVALFSQIDRVGLDLKPNALLAREKSESLDPGLKNLTQRLKSVILMTLYITYRGYRGFFVILPKVFVSVQGKLMRGLEDDLRVFEDDELGVTIVKRGEESWVVSKLRSFRNNLVVTSLASIVVGMYVIRGLAGLLFKSVRRGVRDKNIDMALDAASEEIQLNEERILRVTMGGQDN